MPKSNKELLSSLLGLSAQPHLKTKHNQIKAGNTNAAQQSSVAETATKVSLGLFIEENTSLLEALGIFTALTVFAAGLPLKGIASVLSFLFLAATVVIWFELWERFPKSGTGKLILFENILQFIILVFIGYWLIDFRDIWRGFLFLPIWFILMYVFSTVAKKTNAFNRIFQTKPGGLKVLRYLIGIFALLGFLELSALLSQYIAVPINSLLDNLRESFK